MEYTGIPASRDLALFHQPPPPTSFPTPFSQSMSSDTSAKAKGYVGHIVEELKDETTVLAKTGGSAVVSFAWLWPIRGLLYTVTHPQIILSVRTSLVKSLISSAAVFGALALLTYAPQAALLTLVTGPFGPILALFLLGAESIFVLSFFAKPLFLEPTLQQVFDSTLLATGQKQLVKDGKTRSRGASAGGHALLRPLIALSQGGIARYLITLPLNLIPILGTVFFVLINGHRAGPSWHARYFQLKGFDAPQRQAFIDKYQAEYTAFGIAALLFSFIPVVGLVFTFTNTVGAALWAAQLEAGQNVLEPPAAPTSATTDASKKIE